MNSAIDHAGSPPLLKGETASDEGRRPMFGEPLIGVEIHGQSAAPAVTLGVCRG